MDLQSLLGLISQMQSGNKNTNANGVMNFFSQNQKTNNQAQNTNKNVEINNSNQSGLDFSQILSLLSSNSGNFNFAQLFPLLSSLNLPNGFNSINQINGMQNFSSILSSFQSRPNQKATQEKNINQNIIRSKNFIKPIDKFRRP